MKIAVPGMGANVAEHFGHCENFHVFEIVNNQITASETVPNPGHKPGFLPNFLADQGVTIVLAGGIGGGAIDIFAERGVKVVIGASGNAKTAVEAYLNGTLKSGENTCHENH